MNSKLGTSKFRLILVRADEDALPSYLNDFCTVAKNFILLMIKQLCYTKTDVQFFKGNVSTKKLYNYNQFVYTLMW